MRGVPKDLNLKPFRGSILVKLDILENIVYLTFRRPTNVLRPKGAAEIQIGVEGSWTLRDLVGHEVASGRPTPPGLHALDKVMGARVVQSEVKAPTSFVLQFETGHRLEVFDDRTDAESFCLPQAKVHV